MSTFPTVGSVPGGSDGALFNSLWTNAAKAAVAWGLGKKAASYLGDLHLNGQRFTQIVSELGHFRFNVPNEALGYSIRHHIGQLSGRSFWRRVGPRGRVWYTNAATNEFDESLRYLLFRLKLAGVDDAVEFVGTPQVRTLVSNSPMGRMAGWLALTETGRRLSDLGVGMGVDAIWQFGWDLFAHPDWTPKQRGLSIAAQLPGSAVSFGVGVAAEGIVSFAASSVPALAGIGAFAGPVGIAAGLIAAVLWDHFVTPHICKSLGLE